MSYRPRLRWPFECPRFLQNRLILSLGDRITSILRNSNLRGRWLNILLILLLGLFVIFANVSGQIPRPTASTITLNATIYLPTATLKPILQSHVDQQAPGGNQGWIGSLIHTSVTKLIPQSDGLAMTVSQSLYPGDSKPIDVRTLLKFSVLDSSTIQVSAQPMRGSLALLNGPLTQIKVPAGHLNSISPTPKCGDSALAVKMGFPISTGQGQKSSQTVLGQPYEAIPRIPTQDANAYIEIPSSALSSLGNDLGSFQINDSLTAQNIHIGIQNNEMVVRSDISLWPMGIMVGSSTMHIQPLIKDGNLLFHVRQTDLSILFFTFPADRSSQRMEDKLNQKLADALAGLFRVTKVSIGPDKHIPCAASDSLILTGTTDMVS